MVEQRIENPCVSGSTPLLGIFINRMKIQLKLSAFNEKDLNKLSNKILQKSNMCQFNINGPIYLPTKRQLFTVLKSPHVNKTARDQFQLKIYKRLLVIDCSKINFNTIKYEIKLFLNYIKTLSGAVQIKIVYKTL